MLEIKDLSVSVDKRVLFDNVNLSINKKEIFVILGPNGVGKSTLLRAILGLNNLAVKSGKIFLEGRNVTTLGITEKSKKGIRIAYQNPVSFNNLTLAEMLKTCLGKYSFEEFSKKEMDLIKKFNLVKHLNRGLNKNFSGGEKKRAELLQILFMKPKVLLLDEIDSGVDHESLKIIAKEINSYVRTNKAVALLITHNTNILDFITIKKACVLIDKKLKCHKSPKKVISDIKKFGYKKCADCDPSKI